MSIIKKVPLPICGVALGCAGLGNLLQSYGEGIRSCCGILSAFCLLLFLLKTVCYPSMLKEDMQNPIMASVSGTFPMTLMLLATYIKPFSCGGAYWLWLFAVLLHVLLIVYFTVKFLFNFDFKKVFTSWYIVYVGIAIAAVTAPAFDSIPLGAATFWFGFVTCVLLLVLVTIRYTKYTQIPEPAQPLFCIYAAPVSLCIAGYVQSVAPKSIPFLLGMLVVSTIIYIIALVRAFGFLKMPFYPSYAAFTFPFVITAIACKQTMGCMMKLGHPMPMLKPVVLVETIIATLFVLYTYYCFMKAIFTTPEKA